MNKKLLFAFLAVVVLSLGITGAALADQADPQYPYGDCPVGAGVGSGDASLAGDSVLHDIMLALYADAFGMDVDILESRLAAGETMYDVAMDLGYSLDEFRALMAEVRVQALDQALSDGLITQEQYDWMIDRMSFSMSAGGGRGMDGSGMGDGTGVGGRGRGGRNSGSCLNN